MATDKLRIQSDSDIDAVSIITLDAVNSLQLKVGDRAYAVIKASSVMITMD
jgi:molybdopterin-binding protein